MSKIKLNYGNEDILDFINSLEFNKYVEILSFNDVIIECKNPYYDINGNIDEKLYLFSITNKCLHNITIKKYNKNNPNEYIVLLKESFESKEETIKRLKNLFLI